MYLIATMQVFLFLAQEGADTKFICPDFVSDNVSDHVFPCYPTTKKGREK